MKYAVFVRVARTNKNAVVVADYARRQANYLGAKGFLAISGQTDELFKRRGYHRLIFSSRKLANKFCELVDENCDIAVSTTIKKLH